MMPVILSLIVLFALNGCLNAAPNYKENLQSFVSDEPLNKHDKTQYMDCYDVRHSGGHNVSGIYTLHLNKSFSYQVQCEHTPQNSFTLIQRRINGKENFKRGFHDYVFGFGNRQDDYWAGLNQIYYLTTKGNTVLTIDMQTWQGHSVKIQYNLFRIRDTTFYTLEIGGYQSAHVVPDDLGFNNGMHFSTYDHLDPYNCAANIHAGWWYNYCSFAMPNGVFYFGGPYVPSGGYYDGIYYNSWMGYGYSLKFFSMSISHP